VTGAGCQRYDAEVIDLHRLAEERSLELHRLVAERVRADPACLQEARARVEGWLREPSIHPHYPRAWKRLLDGPLAELLSTLTDLGEHARALRQATPFAGYVDHRTRWRIWREVRERFEGAA